MEGFSLLLSLICCFSAPCFCQESAVAVKESSVSILPIFKQRHSGRAYDVSRPVTQEQIFILAETAQSAPSSYNEQPWSFIFCDRTTDPQAYAKALSCLVEFNQGWAKNAPLLVVISANTQSEKSNKTNRWAFYDTGAAAAYMAVEATALGLMAHQMGGFDEAKTQKLFNIPAHYIPISVMAIGYETPEESAKILPKQRRPFQENFFLGGWGKGLELKNR